MSYVFDGVDDSMSGTASGVWGLNVATVFLWFAPDFQRSTGTSRAWFSAEPSLHLCYMTGAFEVFRLGMDGHTYDTTIDSDWTIDAWHAMCITYNKTGPAFTHQISGVTIPSGSGSGTWGSTALGTNFYIGAHNATGSPAPPWFFGKIAHFAVWSSVLSSGDRTSLLGGANPLAISTGTRTGYWPMTDDANSAMGGGALSVSGATLDTGDNPTVDPPPTPGEPPVKMNSYRRRRVSL